MCRSLHVYKKKKKMESYMFLTALKSPGSVIALLMFKMRNQIFKVRTLFTLSSTFHLKTDQARLY